MRTITINGITYPAKKFGFNLICDLEENGVSLDTIQSKPMSFIRVYVAMCSGRDTEFAGEQMEQHLIGGGSFDDIMATIQTEMEESGFFRALNKEPEKATPKSKK